MFSVFVPTTVDNNPNPYAKKTHSRQNSGTNLSNLSRKSPRNSVKKSNHNSSSLNRNGSKIEPANLIHINHEPRLPRPSVRKQTQQQQQTNLNQNDKNDKQTTSHNNSNIPNNTTTLTNMTGSKQNTEPPPNIPVLDTGMNDEIFNADQKVERPNNLDLNSANKTEPSVFNKNLNIFGRRMTR